MMTNLFIMFDPTTNFLSLNWMSFFFPIIIMLKYYFFMNSRINFITTKLYNFVVMNLKTNMKKSQWKMNNILMTIFMLIYLMNIISLLPFVFTPTSHMTTNLFLALPVWTSIMIFMIYKNYNYLLAHLVPMGSPIMLIPFMVLIETISLMIRPMTLMIRLTANMIAGHILISLVSKMMTLNFSSFLTSFILMNLLLTLEMSVAMIQGYVFIILLSLYIKETY